MGLVLRVGSTLNMISSVTNFNCKSQYNITNTKYQLNIICHSLYFLRGLYIYSVANPKSLEVNMCNRSN